MKKRIFLVLLAMTMLLLTGCGSFFLREYSVVEPHSSGYYENEDVLRAESYQDVVNDLLILTAEQKKEGIVWFYGSGSEDAADIADRACREVQQETPLGAYAVDYLTYTIDTPSRNYTAISFTLGYRRSGAQMDAIVHITSITALPNLLDAAAENGAAELTVQLSYFENQQQEVRGIVADVHSRHSTRMPDPWQVNFYPESGDAGIIEIILKK